MCNTQGFFAFGSSSQPWFRVPGPKLQVLSKGPPNSSVLQFSSDFILSRFARQPLPLLFFPIPSQGSRFASPHIRFQQWPENLAPSFINWYQTRLVCFVFATDGFQRHYFQVKRLSWHPLVLKTSQERHQTEAGNELRQPICPSWGTLFEALLLIFPSGFKDLLLRGDSVLGIILFRWESNCRALVFFQKSLFHWIFMLMSLFSNLDKDFFTCKIWFTQITF